MKKAQFIDLALPIVIIFFLAVTSVVGAKVVIDFRAQAGFTGIPLQVVNDGIEFYQGFDTGIIIIFLVLIFINILTVFFLNTHPIFLVLQIVFAIALFIMPVILMDVFDQIEAEKELEDALLLFPKTSVLMNNLQFAYLGVVILWFAAFFIKIRFFGGGSDLF